jgi:hypothetical protein
MLSTDDRALNYLKPDWTTALTRHLHWQHLAKKRHKRAGV